MPLFGRIIFVDTLLLGDLQVFGVGTLLFLMELTFSVFWSERFSFGTEAVPGKVPVFVSKDVVCALGLAFDGKFRPNFLVVVTGF